MEKQPLLQFYVDETWGYNVWDEERKRKEGIRVKFQQEEGESREDFFKRVGFEPKAKMYGSNLRKDKNIRDRWNNQGRKEEAKYGYGLDVLVYDWDEWVRREVAKHGYGLDILIYDESPDVRCAVAEQGHGLDYLAHDEVERVRQSVAEQGHGLDYLVKDKDPLVRCAVASRGAYLETLIVDKNEYVRAEVVKQGYGLNIIKKDTSPEVRRAARNYFGKHGYSSLEEWEKENPRKVVPSRLLIF